MVVPAVGAAAATPPPGDPGRDRPFEVAGNSVADGVTGSEEIAIGCALAFIVETLEADAEVAIGAIDLAGAASRGSLMCLESAPSVPTAALTKSLRIGPGDALRRSAEGGEAALVLRAVAGGGGTDAETGGRAAALDDPALGGTTCSGKDWMTLYRLLLVSCAASLM